MPTVSAHLAHALVRHVDHVFGVMGNGNAHLLDALERSSGATYTALRHEAGGVAAADAFFRASGRIAAATATYGAGFTNTLTALAESVQAHVPLLLVVGDAPTAGPRPWDVDQPALAAAVGAATFTVTAEDVAATVTRAVHHALTHRAPAVIAIPYDLAARDAGPIADAPDLVPAAPPAPSADAIRMLADALEGAHRPLLLAGRGAWEAGAAEALGGLADVLGAVTVSTALGRGIFPRSEFDLGVAGGFGAAQAMALVHEADVAVVFGASLTQFTMRFGELFADGTRVLQVDVAPAATHARVDGFARGDAALVAREVAAELDRRGVSPTGWREAAAPHALRGYDAADEFAPDGRLDPRAVAARIGALLPEDRVVVSDGGHFIGWANMYWPVAAPDRMMMVGTAYQSIGLGWPCVPGAVRARPGATVVLSTRDGGGLMALAHLESAVRVAGGHGMAVVWNDAAYGAEVNLYGLQGLAREPMLIPQVDFAALATAVGAEGVVVRTLLDLGRLAEWVATPADARPFLVLDCRISGAVIAPYQEEIIRVNGVRRPAAAR